MDDKLLVDSLALSENRHRYEQRESPGFFLNNAEGIGRLFVILIDKNNEGNRL